MKKTSIALCITVVLLFNEGVSYGKFSLELPIISSERIVYSLHSGTYSGTQDWNDPQPVFRETISIKDAKWMRLHFEDYNLGHRSYLTVTSQKDGEHQKFTSKSLSDWNNSSAYFNGDEIEVKLFVSINDQDIFFKIDSITLAKKNYSKPSSQNKEQTGSNCPTDNRTSSEDLAVGRIITVEPDSTMLCTAFIVSNGLLISAGHCMDGTTSPDIIQFNVPPSNADGSINHPPIEDQFAIISSSIIYQFLSPDHDWAIFKVSPNSNSGLLPVQAYGEFYRVRQGSNANEFRVTGYGFDAGVNRYTQQSATGNNVFNSGGYILHEVYSEPGNSGSPIIEDKTNLSVGIHTQQSCPYGGTSFDNLELAEFLNDYYENDVKYVDNGHLYAQSYGAGSIFEPYSKIEIGLENVVSGGTLSIVSGEYPEAFKINKAVTLVAPVGKVTIGGTGKSKKIDRYQEIRKDTFSFGIAQNFPNPFNPTTKIKYTIPTTSHVQIEIFDVIGRRISLLVDKDLTPGTYHSIWDASSFSSGVYFYRIRTDSFTQTRSMTLIK